MREKAKESFRILNLRKSLTIRPNDPIKIQRKRDHIQIQGKCHRRSFT